MTRSSRPAAEILRALGVGLAGWGALVHVAAGSPAPMTLAFAGVAGMLPLRAGPDPRARALACFAGGALLAGLLATKVWRVGLWLVLLGRADFPFLQGAETLFLVGAVALTCAGAIYWMGGSRESVR